MVRVANFATFTECFRIPLFSDTHKNHIWIGLSNPSGIPCANKSCEGKLKWSDGADFLYDSNWLTDVLPVQSTTGNNCFYFDEMENAIADGDCGQSFVVMCQSEKKCPSNKIFISQLDTLRNYNMVNTRKDVIYIENNYSSNSCSSSNSSL